MLKAKRIVTIIIFVIICCISLQLIGCSSTIYESSDISTYRNFDVGSHGGDGNYSIGSFPENLDRVEKINNYYFVAEYLGLYSPFLEIVLDVTYSEENYYFEIERISGFFDRRNIKFDSKCALFNFPTYVARYRASASEHGQTYEYISIDEPNLRIIYINLDCPDRENKIRLSQELLPKNFYKNKDKSTIDGYYYNTYTGSDNSMIWID